MLTQALPGRAMRMTSSCATVAIEASMLHEAGLMEASTTGDSADGAAKDGSQESGTYGRGRLRLGGGGKRLPLRSNGSWLQKSPANRRSKYLRGRWGACCLRCRQGRSGHGETGRNIYGKGKLSGTSVRCRSVGPGWLCDLGQQYSSRFGFKWGEVNRARDYRETKARRRAVKKSQGAGACCSEKATAAEFRLRLAALCPGTEAPLCPALCAEQDPRKFVCPARLVRSGMR